jgi:dehydrogenase/reductase SDR family member 12
VTDSRHVTQVRRFATEWVAERKTVDVLVNNAGRIPGETRETVAGGAMESAFAIMGNGTFLLTSLLRPVSDVSPGRQGWGGHCPSQAFVPGSRVVNVSSGGMYTVGLRVDNLQLTKHYSPLLAYSHSKRAQVILSEEWAKRLSKEGVVVSCMHPGWALTEGVRDSLDGFSMGGELRTPAQGADTIVWLVSVVCIAVCVVRDGGVQSAAERAGDMAAVSGKFFLDRAPVTTHLSLAWTQESERDRRALWDECCTLFDVPEHV